VGYAASLVTAQSIYARMVGLGRSLDGRRAVMASMQIVCVDRGEFSPDHRHITLAGTGDASGWDTPWTVAEVRAAIADGDRFYTVSPATHKTADVEPFDCSCSAKTIRSNPDAEKDNNLDSLTRCT
jgi:hypothetical protein